MSKVVLITGASSGIGSETAMFLAQRGYTVYAGTRNPLKLKDVHHKNLHILPLDIKDQENITDAVKQITDKHNRIDVLINNAGYGLVSTVEDVTEEEMFEQFNINVFGVLRVCKSVIPVMRENQAGIIINISSFLGKIGLPLLTFYNASKYAVEGVTDSLRYELRDFNIRVHSIMPGFFSTNFAKDNLVVNKNISDKNSPYASLISNLAPTIIEQINSGNAASEAAELILKTVEDENAPARTTVGDKASKFIPMRRELSDEDFERRVRDYYNLD
ncbi:MAG: SDR family NAD(P)-dependent oxidoreductase [Epsilonproteobacteria bacterium]|nr:MAG: SDR family NAD(P)-dependent oxidoreductase [Campylobacterota bacterium]